MSGQSIKSDTLYQKFKRKPEYMGVVLIVAIVILNIAMEGFEFFNPSSIQSLFITAMPLVILTAAQVIVLISGNLARSCRGTCANVRGCSSVGLINDERDRR